MLAVRVIPRAGRSAIAGVRRGALLVRVAAAPADGAANAALAAVLARALGVPPRAIQLMSGARARDKQVRVEGLSAAAVLERLGTRSAS